MTAIYAGDVNGTDLQAFDNYGENTAPLNDLELNSSSDISNIETVKNQTELIPSESTYYKGNYSVLLKDSNSSANLTDRTVDLIINDVKYNVTTDNKGFASVSLDLLPGKYAVNAFFAGDESHDACNLTSEIKILSTIKAKDMTKYYKGSAKYSATFYDSQGMFLSNRNVNVMVNGKSYTKKTNSKGSISFDVNFKPGTYKIVSFDPVTGYNLTTTLKVLSTISSSSISTVEGDSKKFTAKFYKSNGKALAKQQIKFKIKGKTYKVKTDKNGKASFSLKNLKKGSYNIVCYNKDGLSKTYKIKVFKRKASTKLTTYDYQFFMNETKAIKIKFTTALGDKSCSGKLIKITINKKTYSRKTDTNGLITFKLPSLKKGLYTVEYKYAGSKFFKAASSKKLLTLLDTKNTKLSIKGTSAFGYGAGTLLKVAYTAGGVPLAKKAVTLNINGKTYFKTTDNKGLVSVPINLKIGDYVVACSAENQSKLYGTSDSFDINVFKRNASKVIWKCGSSFKDNVQNFKVLVTDLNGKPVSGGTITLTIDGEDYTSTVASNGYAKFKTEVAIGKYKVSVKFNGNNYYLSSNTHKTVNVKLSKFASGLNEKNAAGYIAYLKSSSHCKVGSSIVKSLVKSLTSGLTNKIDKAKAIFNYVRDNLDYSYYFNTKYGSTKTLKLKKGNCVDHSHLLVAMFRTAGFKARYVHGVCHFIKSGDTCGHVWTQVKIGKNWVCADAISYSNSLGKIKNWNTKSYHIHAKYASLPF